MKKVILILLCMGIFVTIVSCNKINKIYDMDLNNNSISKLTDNDSNNHDDIDNSLNKDISDDFSKLTFYDMNSSYDSFYINRKPMAEYTVTDDSKLCVYIHEWDEYRLFDYDFEKYKDLINCVSIHNNQGILINETYYKGIDDLDIFMFSKESDEIVKRNIALDKTIHLSGLFCGFLDEKNGYIFVFEEVTDDSLPKAGCRLAFLFKTYDGGETWIEVESDGLPIVPSNESPIIAEFIDDNIGILSCRDSGSDIYSRTFLTYDRGKTWRAISTLPYNFQGIDYYNAISVSDFLYVNNEYQLTVRVRSNTGDVYYLKFISADLNSWILS